MKKINLFSKLWSSGGNSQSSDVGYDSRSTVGSPSGLESSTLLKFVSVLAILLTIGSGNVWGVTENRKVTLIFNSSGGTNSGTLQDSTCYITSLSDAVTDIISFSANKGAAANVPAVYAELRFYKAKKNANGGSVTLTAGSSIENITRVDISAVSGYTRTSTYKIDSGSETSISWSSNAFSTGTISASSSFTIHLTENSNNTNQLRISQIVVYYTAEVAGGCSNAVALSNGTATNGTINSISSASVATCGDAASRQVTVTITPADCFDAPSTLNWTKSSGTVSASKQSGPTDNGDGTYSYVYQFAQNDNGAGTFGVTCTAKAAGKTVNFNAGPGSCGTSSLTETCDGSGVTLPAVTATGVCKGWTTFAGWATAAVNDSNTTSVTVYAAGSKYTPATNNMTLYAVYSKSKSGGSSYTTIAPEDLGVSSSSAINGASVGTITFGGAKGDNGTASNVPKYYEGTPNTIRCYASNDFTISSTNTISQIDFTYNGSYTGGTISLSTGSWAATPTTNWDQTWTGSATSITFRIGSTAWRITSIKVTTGGGSTTYYCSDPNCCTPLGSINGSISLSNAGCSAGQLKATWKTNSEGLAGIASQTLHIYDADDDTEVTAKKITGLTAQTSNQTQTISGLTLCHAYYVKVENISNGGSYCGDGWAGDKSSNATTLGYTYGITKTNVTLKAGADEEASTCAGNFSAQYEAAAGYELPATLTVTGASAHTWSVSNGVGTLSISTANVTGNVTTTIAGICVTPSFTDHPASKTDYLTTDVATALDYEASAAGASLTQQWQVSDDGEDWDDIGGATSATYTPNIATEGTKYYRVKVTNSACSSSAYSDPATITSTAPSGYCISLFNSSNNGIQNGFSNGGFGSEYTLSFTVPGKDGSNNWPGYWIGEDNSFKSFSANATLADMKFTQSNATIGLAAGATGTLHIWDDNKADGSNLHVKFEPSGYGFRWGGAGEWDQAANTKAFTVDANNANTYWTEIVTLDGTNNQDWSYYVGLQTASGYVYSGVDNEASDSRGISRTRSVTTMKVSNGTAGQYKATNLNSEATGTRGKFRIWDNNITDYNFVCHFVPYYRVTYNGSGASGSTDPSADVSCEGDDAARTVVAAANGFTVPTGKTFGGWASSPENAAAGVVAYAAGANVVLTSSITLYAIWTDINYTVTMAQSPAAGATLSGGTTTAHYGGIINISTDVPSGYQFVNWTASPSVTFASASSTSTSFTMPASNVTITANFTRVDTYIDEVWNTVTAGQTGTYTRPTIADQTPGGLTDCQHLHYHFAGWVTETYKASPSGHLAPTGSVTADGTTYYAVWEKEAAGGGSLTKLTSSYVPTEGDNLVIVEPNDSYALYQETSGTYVAYWNFSNSSATVGADDKNYVTLVSDGASGWYLGDATNGYVYNGSSNNLTVDASNQTSFSITWNSTGFNIIGNSRWLSCRTDVSNPNTNKYRMGGLTSGNASGTVLFDLYKYVGVSYTDPIAECGAVTCGAPTTPTNESITAYGATIGWTENSPGELDTYEYAVWVHGEVEPTSGYSTAATNSATITGKTCSTQYDWKVRKVCTDDDGESEFLYSSFTTSNVTLSFDVSGVSGVSSVANQASNVALPTPSPNAVPTSCGECWEFTGWTPSSSYTHGTSKFFAAGSIAHLESGDGTTLYPVYARDEFKLVSTLADISADNYYVLTMDIEDNDEFALLNTVSGNDANVLDILDPTNYLQIRYGSYWLYNPPTSIIWKMTGTTSSGSLYNEAGDVYLDLASSSSPILKSGTPPSHSLLIELYDMGTDLEGNELLDVYNISNSGNYLSITSSEATISTEARTTDEFSAYIYKRISCTYTTSPSCTYTVTWNNNGSTSTTDVSICAGELSNEQMPNTSSYSLDCADKFVGWSRSNLGADLGQIAPDDLFSTAAASPYIRNDEEFFAVYATEDDESSSYVDDVLNQSLTGVSGTSYVDVSDLTDASGAVYAGKCAGDHSSIQLNGTSPNAIVTTTSGGLARKVTVVWEANTANDRTLDIYGKNTAYSSGADLWDNSNKGTKIGSIICGTSTELTITDDYEFIGFRSSSSAMYLTSVTIKWEQPGYKDYVTTCCDKTVTLSSNVTGQGAVSFSAAALATCVAGSATMTITPTAGYKLTAFNTEGTTATPNSMVPAGGVTVPSESTQIITLNYNANATGAYVANPTFEAILVSSLTLHAQKLDNEDNVIFDQTSNAVALSMYPTEGKTASPADPLGHKASISFGAVLPANALNTGYTWSATVNGDPVAFTSNTLNTNSVIEFNKNTGKLVAKAAGTAVITITADDASGVTASVTITVANVALTSVSTTPASLTVYSGQLLPVVVNYDPVNVTTKGYSYSGDDNVTIRNKGNDGFNVEGNSVSVDTHNDLVITTTSDSRQTTLPITIKPLPKVHFVDIVHGESFADVVATIDSENQGNVLFEKHAPTHADISPAPSTPNACENTHLHLIGWIDSEWSGVANYMNNTASKPTTEAIIGATGYFLTPNAEIDTDALKNKTFYAVWAVEE